MSELKRRHDAPLAPLDQPYLAATRSVHGIRVRTGIWGIREGMIADSRPADLDKTSCTRGLPIEISHVALLASISGCTPSFLPPATAAMHLASTVASRGPVDVMIKITVPAVPALPAILIVIPMADRRTYMSHRLERIPLSWVLL